MTYEWSLSYRFFLQFYRPSRLQTSYHYKNQCNSTRLSFCLSALRWPNYNKFLNWDWNFDKNRFFFLLSLPSCETLNKNTWHIIALICVTTIEIWLSKWCQGSCKLFYYNISARHTWEILKNIISEVHKKFFTEHVKIFVIDTKVVLIKFRVNFKKGSIWIRKP